MQDLIRERGPDEAALLDDPDTCVYVCGLKGMEAGMLQALCDAVSQAGRDWSMLHDMLRRSGRLHVETY